MMKKVCEKKLCDDCGIREVFREYYNIDTNETLQLCRLCLTEYIIVNRDYD